MNDVSCKSIMSLQETERIFSGHPSFYKWQYNKKGILSDRSTDQHKRFGGLGRNYFNPALVGRCVAGLVIPDITSSLYKIKNQATYDKHKPHNK